MSSLASSGGSVALLARSSPTLRWSHVTRQTKIQETKSLLQKNMSWVGVVSLTSAYLNHAPSPECPNSAHKISFILKFKCTIFFLLHFQSWNFSVKCIHHVVPWTIPTIEQKNVVSQNVWDILLKFSIFILYLLLLRWQICELCFVILHLHQMMMTEHLKHSCSDFILNSRAQHGLYIYQGFIV